MNAIERFAFGDAIVYVAGRLFDIEEKLKSELLEEAVLAGVSDAAVEAGLRITRHPTFVPFRDAGQEELVVEDKTRRLFELDIRRLQRAALLVSYIDGLAKDEGVCFEIGYAFGAGVPILLISTDFFWLELPSREEVPFDPLLVVAATELLRQPHLVAAPGLSFRDILIATRSSMLGTVRASVQQLLLKPFPIQPCRQQRSGSDRTTVLVDFGGGVFEWQRLLYERLMREVQSSEICLQVTRRYDADRSAADAARADLHTLLAADVLVTCADGDEAPSGSAFLQGVASALGCPIWMYNSKRTWIRAGQAYRSSRNLMLDYSATRVFRSLEELATALRTL